MECVCVCVCFVLVSVFGLFRAPSIPRVYLYRRIMQMNN